jgi:hypothetical protein
MIHTTIREIPWPHRHPLKSSAWHILCRESQLFIGERLHVRKGFQKRFPHGLKKLHHGLISNASKARLSVSTGVETSEHSQTTSTKNSEHVHKIVDMKGVEETALRIDLRQPEADNYAKLAKHGGWTVAFRWGPLWSNISSILYGGSRMAMILVPSESGAMSCGKERKATGAMAVRTRTRTNVCQ